MALAVEINVEQKSIQKPGPRNFANGESRSLCPLSFTLPLYIIWTGMGLSSILQASAVHYFESIVNHNVVAILLHVELEMRYETISLLCFKRSLRQRVALLRRSLRSGHLEPENMVCSLTSRATAAELLQGPLPLPV